MREVVYNDKEWTYEVRDGGRVVSDEKNEDDERARHHHYIYSRLQCYNICKSSLRAETFCRVPLLHVSNPYSRLSNGSGDGCLVNDLPYP